MLRKIKIVRLKIFIITFLTVVMIFSTLTPVFNALPQPATNVGDFSVPSSVPYTFETPEIMEKTLSDNIYTEVKLGNSGGSSDVGKPVLPVLPAKILLPPGEKLDSIQVTHSNPISYIVDYVVQPAQQCYPLNYEGEIEFTLPDEEIYNSNNMYPGELYTEVGTYSFRGYDILVLQLHPVQYIPAKNELLYYPDLAVSVETIEDDNTDTLFRGLEKDELEVNKMIDNPNIVNSYSQQPDGGIQALSGGTFETYEYVIITNNALKNNAGSYSFQALADARTAGGLNARIKSVEEIYSEYTGSDAPDKIRNFIKHAYQYWGTEYVLLGGDDDVVPARTLVALNMPIASDLYYACLDGTGPGGKNGEDLTADVWVGRAPVSTSTEMTNFVRKTLSYENSNDNYLKKALWVGEHLGFGGVAEYGAWMKDQNIGYCTADGYTTDGLPEGGSDGYSIYRLYERDMSWNKNTIINKINSGYHLLNHLGHGNKNYAMKMYNNDVNSLTNTKYFFVYSQTCNAGWFDNYDCFAEQIIAKSSRGAFAAVMNDRYGYGQHKSTDGPSQRYDREFWDAIYGEDKITLGEANHDSKEDNLYRINENVMRIIYYETNLFGDPALKVHGAGGPELAFSPTSHDFGNVDKGEIVSTSLEIWNSDTGTLTYSLSENCDWLTVSPSSGSSTGEHDTINVQVDTTGLSNGSHSCNIIIDSNGGTGIFKVTIKVGSVLVYSPHSYERGLSEGEGASTTFEIWNDGVKTLVYSLSKNCDWLTVSPSGGSSTGEHDTINVEIDTTDLSNGRHSCEIMIKSNGGNGVFTITIGVGSVLAYSPKSYDFGQIGIGETASTSFEIWNDLGETILQYDLSENCNWLTISPSGGSSTGEHDTISVMIDTTSLTSGCGSFTSTIYIDSSGGTGTFNVTVDIIFIANSTSDDGLISCTNRLEFANYSKVWNSTEGLAAYSMFSYLTIGQGYLYGFDPDPRFESLIPSDGGGDIPVPDRDFGSFSIYRGFMFFDTSALSDNTIIKEATLAINGNPSQFLAQDFNIVIQNGQPDYPHIPLESSDYDRTRYHGNGGSINTADLTPGSYNNINLNSDGKTWINKQGITKLCLRSDRDINGIPPLLWGGILIPPRISVSNTINIDTYEGTLLPKLTIIYGHPPNKPSNPSPSNDASSVSINPTLNVKVTDSDGNSMNVYFYDDSDDSLIGVDENIQSGETASVTWENLDYTTTYKWYAVANDNIEQTQSNKWSFTTMEPNDPPVLSSENPLDGSTSISLSQSQLSINIVDNEGDSFDWTITTNPDIGSANGNGESSGIKICSITGLQYDTTYTWTVYAKDSGSGESTQASYTFKTKPNHAPDHPINPSPADDEIEVDIIPTLSVKVSDPEEENLNVKFYFNSTLAKTVTGVPSGTRVSFNIENALEYNTTYSWYVEVDDGLLSIQSEIWAFITMEKPVPPPSVEIVKPEVNILYLRNLELCPFTKTLILGYVDIEASVIDPSLSKIKNVKFYINNKEVESFTYNPEVSLYNWTWSKMAFFSKTIKVVAYDEADAEVTYDEIDVSIFSFGIAKP